MDGRLASSARINRGAASRKLVFLLVGFYYLVGAGNAGACNVPVFRYALERWQPDAYELFVFHREALSPTDLGTVKQLDRAVEDDEKPSNIVVTLVDLSSELSPWAKKLWDEQNATQTPWAVARAPSSNGAGVTVWAGPLEDFKVSEWLESPARQELARRLLEGDSIVWLYLHDGSFSKDDAIYRDLADTLRKVQDEMRLPEGIGQEGSELISSVPLNIKFSILAIDRQIPAEKAFVQQLLHGEEKLSKAKGPLLIPVFGRGRVLEIFDGDDLKPSIYQEVAVFLCSVCSCLVKELNPGFDLLLSVNWTQILQDGLPADPANLVPATLRANSSDEPVYVPIPGKKRAITSDDGAATSAIKASEYNAEDPAPGLVAGLVLVGLMIMSAFTLMIRGFLQ